MGVGIASLSLHLLLIGIQMVVVCSMMMNHNHAADSSSNKPSVYFEPNDLKKGTTKTLYIPKEDPSNSHFWPREETERIPFSSEKLPEILSRFSAPPGSALAETIERTIWLCETPPIEGETKICVTSIESMLDFVVRIFGISKDSEDSPRLLTPTFRPGHRETYQNYTFVESLEEVSASKIIACHTMSYPYGVLYCHDLGIWNKVYKALLQGQNGDFLEMYFICHFDTSHWDSSHPSFSALGTGPGTPVCHFFPPHGHILWIHNDPPTPKFIKDII